MTCPKCNAQLPPTAISCSQCGTKFKSKTCLQCGARVLSTTVTCPHCGKPANQAPGAAPASTNNPVYGSPQVPAPAPFAPRPVQVKFRTWKLVSGILSIVLSVLVMFQSCAAGLANTLSNNGEVSGSAGVLVAVMLLSSGIVSIAVRNSIKNGGNIAIIVLNSLAALVGFVLAGSYMDLYIWSAWCLVCAVMAIVAIAKMKQG